MPQIFENIGNPTLFWIQPNLTESLTIISRCLHPLRNSYPTEALHALMQKNTIELVRTQKCLSFFNRLFLVPKPSNWWRPILDLVTLNKFLKTKKFKMETPETKDLPSTKGVCNVHRLQGSLLPYSNKQSVPEISTFSCSRSFLPIQSTNIWSVQSTHGIHGGGEGGQTDGFTQEYKNPAVPRRLVGQSQIQLNLSPANTNPSSFVSGIGLDGKHEKLELDPKQVFDFIGYKFNLKEDKVRPTLECWQTINVKIQKRLYKPTCPVQQLMSLTGLLTAT